MITHRIIAARQTSFASSIPGWGVDADNENDPTWPMRDRAFDDAPGRHWSSPTPQAQDVDWKHDRPAFLQRSAAALVVAGAALGAIGVLAWRRRA